MASATRSPPGASSPRSRIHSGEAAGGPGGRDAAPPSTRIDVWLDVACLFKTRAEAQRACRAGKVEVGGQSAKPHRLVRAGDEIRITRGGLIGKQTVIVRGVAEHHVGKAAAREMYEDRTPLPPAEVLDARRLERLFWKSHPHPVTTPDKRERRELRRLKGRS